jgi:type IV secretory pathway VirJ component
MRCRTAVFGLLCMIVLGSCSVLKRNRISNNHGQQMDDLDLPVIVYPSAHPASKRLLIMLSGDGGWMDFNDQLAASFAKRGFNVVGLNSRSYFWEQRTPEQTTSDILRLINQYSRQYKTNRLYLTGYSFGADVIPFVYNRLPLVIKKKVVALQLLSPFASSDFMIHTSDLLNLSSDNKTYKVEAEIASIRIPVLCFYGDKESPKALGEIKKRNFFLKHVAGDHHYDLSGNEKIVNSLRSLRLLRR